MIDMAGDMLVILTGPSGSGKSTVCAAVAARAAKAGLSVGGVVTERPHARGELVGRDVVDLADGGRVPLAERDRPADGPATDHWRFHRAGIAWGASRLAAAGGADLFVVDELGPLELLRDEGWRAAIDVLAARDRGLSIAVVRPELVEPFVARLAGRPHRVIDVSAADRDALPDELLAAAGRCR